ncbi:nicotinate-nicotinamide nucleotide adenylyltransferase [Vibrio sp. JC009]|uniref:nicotinate-nicotinamide nucleotide adenylyltransferase n=1 Tax=Vibrio sp. JC009 TaxID=2912314 RepID=UPI0023B19D05|nr:nicotinate-nicotinamide nucleotide adenylyltransferase [Vibrio sp. JC009]WED24328.1 nicotinate-nicotinamide nucleotide adenylyltransferase [Vibrio sp. JC009]
MNTKQATKSKIAVFGSAFNPPSLGHKSVIDSLTHFDKVLLVPSISHAWGKEMLDYSDRCKMVDLFIHDMAQDNVERSTVEELLHVPGQSVTTYAVLEKLQELYPEAELTFVIGPDNLFKFSSFFNAELITERWSVMAFPEKVKVRSTDIRNNLKKMRSVTKLTTKSVADYLIINKIYI